MKNGRFIEHLQELRRRFIASFLVAFCIAVTAFLLFPQILSLFLPFFGGLPDENGRLYLNLLYEGFISRLRLALTAGIVAGLPFHLLNLIGFIFPALSTKEKRVSIIFLSLSLLLTITGLLYSYHLIIPLLLAFFTGPAMRPDGVGLLLNYQNNLFFLINFLLAAAALFQAPLFMGLLLTLRLVSLRRIIKLSRYLVVAVFIIAAVATPPDVVSQVAIALPLLLLLALVIAIAKIFSLGKKDRQE